MKSIKFLMSIVLIFFSFGSVNGNSGKKLEDWSQFRGPNRDGKSTETGLMKIWPKNGPEKVWTVDGIGEGYSTVSISNGLIYTTGMIDDLDYITAFNKSGKKLWQVSYGKGWTRATPGVRITPTINDQAIYLISGMGEIKCLSASNGELIWSVDAYTKFEGEYGIWGIAENLLVVDGKLIYTPAGKKTTMVALDKITGATIWTSESLNDKTGYVSPILIERNGKKIIANITANYLLGVNANNGVIEWKVKYTDIKTPDFDEEGSEINCIMPIYKNGKLFITSGYNHTAVVFNLSEDGSAVDQAWKEDLFDSHHGGVVEVDGYLYGSNWLHNGAGNWLCLNWETGEVMYETKWKNKGSILYADGMLYCYEERRGNIALVEPTPKEFKIISTLKVEEGSGPHWAYPVIHDGTLYIRHGETLSAYDIKDKL